MGQQYMSHFKDFTLNTPHLVTANPIHFVWFHANKHFDLTQDPISSKRKKSTDNARICEISRFMEVKWKLAENLTRSPSHSLSLFLYFSLSLSLSVSLFLSLSLCFSISLSLSLCFSISLSLSLSVSLFLSRSLYFFSLSLSVSFVSVVPWPFLCLYFFFSENDVISFLSFFFLCISLILSLSVPLFQHLFPCLSRSVSLFLPLSFYVSLFYIYLFYLGFFLCFSLSFYVSSNILY